MADFDRVTRSLALWVPDNMDATGETMRITKTMVDHFKIELIDKTKYAGSFEKFYDEHIRNFETPKNSFCSKDYLGVNPAYVTANSDKDTFATLLSIDNDDYGGDIVRVNALITFRWSQKAKAIKIQTLCSDQRVKSTGEGTKLLNFVKKTANHMGIYKIYLNPLQNAVPFYYRHQFRKVTALDKVRDTSDSSSASAPVPAPASSSAQALSPALALISSQIHKTLDLKKKYKNIRKNKRKTIRNISPSSSSHAKKMHGIITKDKLILNRAINKKEQILGDLLDERAKKKTARNAKSSKSPRHSRKKSSKSSKSSSAPPSMIINLRARSNWNKTKMKLKAMSTIKRKRHGKSTAHVISQSVAVAPRQKMTRNDFLCEQIDDIMGSLSEDVKSMMTQRDVYERLENKRISNLTPKDKQDIDFHMMDEYGINY